MAYSISVHQATMSSDDDDDRYPKAQQSCVPATAPRRKVIKQRASESLAGLKQWRPECESQQPQPFKDHPIKKGVRCCMKCATDATDGLWLCTGFGCREEVPGPRRQMALEKLLEQSEPKKRGKKRKKEGKRRGKNVVVVLGLN